MHRAVSSAVEHYLDMVGVTGSNPVSPTKTATFRGGFFYVSLQDLKPRRKKFFISRQTGIGDGLVFGIQIGNDFRPCFEAG